MDRRSGWTMVVCAAMAALPLGCAQSPRPLTADLFAPPAFDAPRGGDGAPTPPADPTSPTKAFILTPLQPHFLGSIQPLDALDIPARPVAADAPAEPASAVLAPAPVVQPVQPSTSPVQASPAPVPGASTGVYMTLGVMLARVNGTPIYSGQILRRLAKEFTAKARELSEGDFRDFACTEIARQRDELIQDERVFSLVLDQLDQKDRELAEMYTILDEQRRISAAGGSREAARKQAAEEGEDFDDAMTRAYREIVQEVFQHKFIDPLVQIGRDDLLRFYKQNVDKMYSEKSKAFFRVIQIDPAALTGTDTEQLALQKITAIHDKAVAGADFASLASAENTDSYLKSHGGDPGGWMEPNTYRIEELEKAVWQLQPGQVTPVIKSQGAYYIAKLCDKKVGATRPFSDSQLQLDMYNRIEQQQRAKLWQLAEENMLGDVEIFAPEDRIVLAADLAVQKFVHKNP